MTNILALYLGDDGDFLLNREREREGERERERNGVYRKVTGKLGN
jgi:hypothetical protein